jgi:hypothetical protein
LGEMILGLRRPLAAPHYSSPLCSFLPFVVLHAPKSTSFARSSVLRYGLNMFECLPGPPVPECATRCLGNLSKRTQLRIMCVLLRHMCDCRRSRTISSLKLCSLSTLSSSTLVSSSCLMTLSNSDNYAVDSHGNLMSAERIVWYNDPDDATPISSPENQGSDQAQVVSTIFGR